MPNKPCIVNKSCIVNKGHIAAHKRSIDNMCHVAKIAALIQLDGDRYEALRCVASLNLPDGYIAAGFVRNMVWDWLHDDHSMTPLNDVDVIYFDRENTSDRQQRDYECQLSEMMPNLHWQVRNQATMHIRNGDSPYKNTRDAMGYWPEKETAVAVRIAVDGQLICMSAFGLETLFQGKITHNPKRDLNTFEQRVASKGWLTQWSKLRING